MEELEMNIGSGLGYPSANLSNFHPHHFTVHWAGFSLECHSMEGFLQALKFANPDMQRHVATLVGSKAKYKGKKKNWQVTQNLWWNGVAISRSSDAYQQLLDAAYESLFLNEAFRKALKATGNATLTHTIGRTDPHQTVLTRQEFCSRLTNLRRRL